MIPEELKAKDVFSAEDANRIGFTERLTRLALGKGEITRVRRSWFTASAPTNATAWHRLHVLVALREHPGTVAASVSALVLLDLPVRTHALQDVHLVRVDAGCPRVRGQVIIHARPAGFAVCTTGQCVSIPLACVQAALRDPVTGLMAADAAAHQGGATRDEILELLDGFRGHRGVVAARLALELVDGRRESPGESECAYTCHRLGFELEPQVEIRGRSGRQYRVDALVKGTKVIVEYDGEGKYACQADLLREKKREDDLRAAGYLFVRVTKDLLRQPQRLLDLLLRPAA